MKRTIRVRFHLGQGNNYMKWRVENTISGETRFINPNTHRLIMRHTKLYNQVTASQKIHCGGNKTVCAWVMCGTVDVVELDEPSQLHNIVSYNPRKVPFWRSQEGNNIDKECFAILFTLGHSIGQSITIEVN